MTELTKWAKAKPEATMGELVELAAADVKATTQNYDMVPKLLKELSQRGMVVGTYISFTSELFRNTAGTFNLAQKEIRSGNPELVKAGFKRIAGIAGTALVLYGMFHDDTQEEEEKRWAINEIAKPPWNDGQRLWMLDDEKGRIRYADPAYMIPHAYFYNIVANFTSASLEGEPGRGISDALTAFGSVTDMNIFMQTAMEIAMNKKESGAEIYNEARAETDAIYKATEVAKHITKSMYTPGFVRTLDKIEKAQKGEPGFKGVVATQDDLMAQLISIRPTTIDYRSKRFQVDTFRPLARSLREANKIDSQSKMIGKTAEEQLELVAKQEEVTEVFVEKTRRAVKAMQVFGIGNGHIRSAMKEAGIPKAVQRQAFKKPKDYPF